MNMMEPTLAPYMEQVQDMPLEITDTDVVEKKDNEASSKARITFSRKFRYFLALITEDAAKIVVRQNTAGNGFETW